VLPLRDNVPTRRFPVVTVALIAVNAAIWLFYELPDLNGAVNQLAFRPCEVQNSCAQIGDPWWTDWLSAMFLHASWEHILGNMLFLWIFGNNVEDAMGRVGYLAFYLLGGIAATALQTVVTLWFGTPGDASVPNLGASGAISAVLGAYFILLPNARVLTLFGFFFIEIHAFWFLGIWFLFQFVEGGASILQPQAGGGTAFFAHIGGFAFGVLTVRAFVRQPPLLPTTR
jgi:rhomboid family protein